MTDLITIGDVAMDARDYASQGSTLRSLGLVDYPERGKVVALPILFIEGRSGE